jgi:heme exporter protein B
VREGGVKDSIWAAFWMAEKDLRVEFRRPYELLSVLAFAIGALLLAGILVPGAYRSAPAIASAVIWIILFFSAILLCTTSFIREAELGTLGGLRSLPCSPLAILAGKVLSAVILLFALEAVLLVLAVPFLGLHTAGSPVLLGVVLILGALGLACAGSFVSGLAMFAEGKTLIISLLLLPVSLPVLVLGGTATGRLVGGGALAGVTPEVTLLLAYLLVVIAVMILTFGVVLEE